MTSTLTKTAALAIGAALVGIGGVALILRAAIGGQAAAIESSDSGPFVLDVGVLGYEEWVQARPVYEAVVRQFRQSGYDGGLHVQSSLRYTPNSERHVRDRLPGAVPETVQSFATANSHRLRLCFIPARAVAGATTCDDPGACPGGELSHLAVSPIGFNSADTQAIVLATMGCGPTSGEHRYCLLERTDDEWTMTAFVLAGIG